MTNRTVHSDLPSQEEIFSAYLDGDFARFHYQLRAYLPIWARDALRGKKFRVAESWAEELEADGDGKLFEVAHDCYFQPLTKDARHLLYSIRQSIRKEMRQSRMFLTWDPCPPYHALSWYLDHGIRTNSLETVKNDSDSLEPDVNKCLLAPDTERNEEWFRFLDLFVKAFEEAAKQRGWNIPPSLFAPYKRANVSAAGRALGFKKNVLCYRLQQLGRDVVKAATQELAELGEQFLDDRWKYFGKNLNHGHRNLGGKKQAA
jgi:hypothetical protein